MKFKKDGKTFEDIEAARREYCRDKFRCYGCALGKEAAKPINACYYMAKGVPATAARLMGYEVVGDSEWEIASDGDGVVCPHCREDFCVLTNETDRFLFCPNCGERVGKETNMDKQKPRICEVLGTNPEEMFEIKGKPEKKFRINKFGNFQCETSLGHWTSVEDIHLLISIIETPHMIVRKPHFAVEEVAAARAIVRMFGPNSWTHIGKTEEGYPQLEDKDEESGIVVATIGINADLFPSIRPGTSVNLSDIVGGKA